MEDLQGTVTTEKNDFFFAIIPFFKYSKCRQTRNFFRKIELKKVSFPRTIELFSKYAKNFFFRNQSFLSIVQNFNKKISKISVSKISNV